MAQELNSKFPLDECYQLPVEHDSSTEIRFRTRNIIENSILSQENNNNSSCFLNKSISRAFLSSQSMQILVFCTSKFPRKKVIRKYYTEGIFLRYARFLLSCNTYSFIAQNVHGKYSDPPCKKLLFTKYSFLIFMLTHMKDNCSRSIKYR